MFRIRTAFRYALSKTRGQRATSIMILVGIAIGLVALLVISAVMNGLQNAQMDQLRNLESFDLIVTSETLSPEDLNSIDGIAYSFRFLETNALIVDEASETSQSIRVRAYDRNIFDDSRMSESFTLLSGRTGNLDGMLISYTTRKNLAIHIEDTMISSLQISLNAKRKTLYAMPETDKLAQN